MEMNNKRRSVILNKVTDYPYARDSTNKSVLEVYKEENIYFEQVFYFLMLSLLINQPLASVYFDEILKYRIHSKLT